MKQAIVLLSLGSIVLNILFVITYVSYVSIASFLVPPYSIFLLNKIMPNMYQPLVPDHDGNMSSLSLERRHSCRLKYDSSCESVNKSLVVSFWREKSRDMWLPTNMLRIFPPTHFDHVIMLHDMSNWSNHAGFEIFIWIRAVNQVRFWYFKRFLPPHVLRAYRYVWILDDDARLTFDPLVYECVVHELQVPFSSPTRLSGIAYHLITRQNNKTKPNIGRWTDFVEIGPVVVGESKIWQCLWHYLLPTVGAGYGFDLVWCRMIGELCLGEAQRRKACALLDIFGIHHDSQALSGAGDPGNDFAAHKRFKGFHVGNKNLGLLAVNVQVFNVCSSKQDNKDHN
jgi:hypothetical protein